MRHIKKFENFHEDGVNVDNQTVPEHNQKRLLDAEEYVENIFNAGAGGMINALCKHIGIPFPKTDEEIESAKSTAIEYFKKNYEEIKEITPPEHSTYPFYTGDGIARVTNIGGVHQDKFV